MADLHRSFPNPNQPTDLLVPILEEAKHRWLRPAEIIEIIRSYQRFRLKPEPPNLPPAGSIFLFDRKVLRYFRKDGYRWRKKKDGKTVKEAHEKLKSGSVDVLHCYYAHGEDNESFQRRSYWMLEGQLEHIVLVHYREVKEGYKSCISRLQPSPIKIESPQSSSTPRSTQENSPASTLQTPLATNSRRVDWNPQPSPSQYEDADLGDNSGVPSSTQPLFASTALGPSPFSHGIEGFTDVTMNPFGSLQPRSQFYNYNLPGSSSDWTGAQTSTTSDNNMQDQEFCLSQPVGGANFIPHKLTGTELDVGHNVHALRSDRLTNVKDTQVDEMAPERDFQVAQNYDFDMGIPTVQKYSGHQTAVTFTDQVQESNKEVVPPPKNEVADLKKLDSFGRWMNKAMGDDCDDSLMASSSGNYWNPLSGENDAKEASSLSHHIPLDMVSLEPSLSQEQLFSITDFSPDWAYAGVGTKVLIVGRFMGDDKKYFAETKWGCMFGEIEVPAEVVVDNVLRCITPLHAPGRVPFYVTRSNRLACSEVREFEFLEIPWQTTTNCSPEEELRLQIRLGKLLHLRPERQFSNCRTDDCDKCKVGKTIQSMKIDSVGDDEMSSRGLLIQYLVADRLCEWLVYKIHEGGKGPHVLDDEGQGVIHLAACLGYHWAISPIVAAGVSSNFRDAHGRTGLHWASYFGREETVLELVRLGASPGALEDPTSAFPGGRTAADLASCHGHKGIAGYLAEADLKTQLFQLKIGDNISTADPAEATDDQSMKGSLAAVRKSALAVSLIQDAFRKRSLRHGQLTNRTDDTNPDDSLTVATMGGLNSGQRFGHFEDSLHSAAKSIQKKYRGFRGRSDFLDLRSHVVKIQAHVRGHQVRKHYRNLVWSVSIMEKVILRWRRKGHGLRGFRSETVKEASAVTKKGDEYEFLDVGRKQKSDAVDKAFERVKSMVRHPEAREQYMRLVSRSQNMEMGNEGTIGSLDVNNSKMSVTEQDLPQFLGDQ